MADMAKKSAPPQTIILATDLSSRCDRAMQRALQLAKLWNSRLIILSVVEPDDPDESSESWNPLHRRRPPASRSVAEAQIRRQFGEIADLAEVRIIEGDPASIIQDVAQQVAAELIITGVGRDETFGRHVLGSTVEQLAQRTTVPLLIVKSRVWPYEEILVATDLSESSGQALATADRFFPTAPITALYVAEAPTEGAPGLPDQRQQMADQKSGCVAFIERSGLAPEACLRVKALVDQGRPEVAVRRYMLEKEVDLVVVGSHGQGGVFEKRLGGVARRILDYAPADVLVVRDSRAQSGDAPPKSG
ncbi:MAG: universal stress protein [Phenylobacterium sp.]|uniref:universal stress protein n=1 Tax=Phenylobacterium sp. TaxID=1871053 RepID=UPI002736B897|nr:universal stress protein [Phenylobacterium sp.]MDP1643088.1 universal stress protein [Phenylobacterium sp.]MDP3116925.1 universal stress protein [Phenylobacterium sp.]